MNVNINVNVNADVGVDDEVDVDMTANEKPLVQKKSPEKPTGPSKQVSSVGRRAGVSAETGEDDVRAIKAKRASCTGLLTPT